MGFFSFFKKKKEVDETREYIRNYIWQYMETYCKTTRCGAGSVFDIFMETAKLVNALSEEKIKEAMKKCNVSAEHAALNCIQLCAQSKIRNSVAEKDADSAYKVYEAVIKTKYEKGLISEDQYEADHSYGIELKTGN